MEWDGGYGDEQAGLRKVEVFDGRTMRDEIVRKAVDYVPSVMHYVRLLTSVQVRMGQQTLRDQDVPLPHDYFANEMMPSSESALSPVSCITNKCIQVRRNKVRCPVHTLSWTPEGRRVVTGTSTGEFTLWNGLTFNFEAILQAHATPIRAMKWSHCGSWLVSADDGGTVKCWQTNINNVKMFDAHEKPCRDVSFAPTDHLFATAGDDGVVKLWDFASCACKQTLSADGWEVKTVDWHPWHSLLASGGKDNLVRFWDPRVGASIKNNLHAHKHTITRIRWNQNGNWLLTCARDTLIKCFDVRKMAGDKELITYHGHRKEVTSVDWHPFHEKLFVTGDGDGAVLFWLADRAEAQSEMRRAHDAPVWELQWHPLGHILCTGSNDHTVKFWCRHRPGPVQGDRYNQVKFGNEEGDQPRSGVSRAAHSAASAISEATGPLAALRQLRGGGRGPASHSAVDRLDEEHLSLPGL